MRNVISPKSVISYANQNVVFILWLYNSPHRSLLEESFVEALGSLENEREMKKWIKCLSRGIFHIQQKMIMQGGLISYLGRLTSICLGIMVEFLLVIWKGKGKGKLAAERAVG